MTAQVIPFTPEGKQPEQRCSFCRTPKSKAKSMVEGLRGHAICDKCIERSMLILASNDKPRGVSE